MKEDWQAEVARLLNVYENLEICPSVAELPFSEAEVNSVTNTEVGDSDPLPAAPAAADPLFTSSNWVKVLVPLICKC